MMLIMPFLAAIKDAVRHAGPDDYDLAIVERLYGRGPKTLEIPRRPFHLLTGELRRTAAYLATASGKWDLEEVLRRAKFLHLSDWPRPALNQYKPQCRRREWFGQTLCRDRMMWMQLYREYATKREGVCGSHFEVEVEAQEPDQMVRHGRYFHGGRTRRRTRTRICKCMMEV